MKLSRLSFALILVAVGLALQLKNLSANGPEKQNPSKNNTRSKPPVPTPTKTSNPKQSHPEAADQQPTQDKRGTEEQPLIIKSIEPPESAQERADKRAERNDESTGNRWMRIWAGIAAIAAIITSLVAGGAALIANRTLRAIKDQVAANVISANAAKDAADAAVVAAMPILSPLVVGGNLHPLQQLSDILYPSPVSVNFDSIVHLVFENFGKTPGAIRELRADLFITATNALPPLHFDDMPRIDYHPTIAGESRGENAMMGMAVYKRHFTLTPQQYSELLAEGGSRFTLAGRVIYDDFFGNRHVRIFCIKMRRVGETGLFQIERGGKAASDIQRYNIPADDPLADKL